MPVVVVWLGTILTSLLTGLATAFVTVFTKRVAVMLAAVAILVALTSGFFVAIEALLSGIGLVLPSYLTAGVGLFLPGNIPVCTAAVISAYALRFVYDWNVRVVLAKVS